MKLQVFLSGSIRIKKKLIVMGCGDEFFVIPVPFFLIEHNKDYLLYDCGQPLSAVADDMRPPLDRDNVSIMSDDDYAPNRLRKVGIAPASIKYVIISHLHYDHTGALGSFPNAIHFIQRAELDKSAVDKFRLKLRILDGEEFYDVFDDGSVKIVFTPGHTAGHQSLLLKFPGGGQTLLAGDSVYTDEILKDDALPGIAWNYDVEKLTLKRIRLMKANGVKIVTGHDPSLR